MELPDAAPSGRAALVRPSVIPSPRWPGALLPMSRPRPAVSCGGTGGPPPPQRSIRSWWKLGVPCGHHSFDHAERSDVDPAPLPWRSGPVIGAGTLWRRRRGPTSRPALAYQTHPRPVSYASLIAHPMHTCRVRSGGGAKAPGIPASIGSRLIRCQRCLSRAAGGRYPASGTPDRRHRNRGGGTVPSNRWREGQGAGGASTDRH